jgi:hypothetical protein
LTSESQTRSQERSCFRRLAKSANFLSPRYHGAVERNLGPSFRSELVAKKVVLRQNRCRFIQKRGKKLALSAKAVSKVPRGVSFRSELIAKRVVEACFRSELVAKRVVPRPKRTRATHDSRGAPATEIERWGGLIRQLGPVRGGRRIGPAGGSARGGCPRFAQLARLARLVDNLRKTGIASISSTGPAPR